MKNSDNTQLLRRLLDIGRQMAETRALEPLLIYAVDVALELLNAQYGFIVLSQPDGQLHFQVARDHNGNTIIAPETQVSRTILYRAMEREQHVLTASAVSDSSFGGATSVSMLELKSVLCVPLISQGDVIGAIYLENRAEFDLFQEEDVQPLQYLASHAAVCIQNALLNAEIESLSLEHIQELAELTENNFVARESIEQIVQLERTRILRNFIQNASHQFRTPLSVINTSVDILRRKIDTEKYGNYLDRIRVQINTIVRLVDNLNLLSKLDSSGESNHTLKEENLVLIVHEMFQIMVKQAHQKQIRFQHLVDEEEIYVEIGQDYVRQAIAQILENALQYTNSGGLITIQVVENNDTVTILVKDTGIGVAPEHLPHLTTRFFRVDEAGTTRGLGLGLTITEKIMELHGGKISIDSTVGQGTQVTLIFPKK